MRNPAMLLGARIAVVASIVLACRPVSADLAYQYKLVVNHDADVCGHMEHVFNASFSHVWDSDPLISQDDSHYSADSKYAFERLPSVVHDGRTTFVMRYSRVPNSAEFSAIDWREGRATLGGCPSGAACPGGNEPVPVLIAHFDFDNDGSLDTVVKVGFYAGSLFAGLGAGEEEHLVVWRNQNVSLGGMPSLWDLEHPQDEKNTPVTARGTQLRPFVYKDRTYVARYSREPTLPAAAKKEWMDVVSYKFTGAREAVTGRPIWNMTTVCKLSMQPQAAAAR